MSTATKSKSKAKPKAAKFWKFPKLKSLKPGDVLIADGDFTCLRSRARRVVGVALTGNLFVRCAEGRHYLSGQLNNAGEVVGFKRA